MPIKFGYRSPSYRHPSMHLHIQIIAFATKVARKSVYLHRDKFVNICIIER